MATLRKWKWVAGSILLLIYLGIMGLVLLNHSQSANSPLVSYPTAQPTPDPQLLMIHANNQKRWTQALYHIEAQALQTGWTPDLYRQAGDIWWQMGDITRAIPFWSAALETIDDVDLLRTVANSYIDLAQWTLARQTLERLLLLKSDDEWANYHMGMILAPFNPIKSRLFFDGVPVDSPFAPVMMAVRNEFDNNPQDPLISFRIGLTLVSFGQWDFAELAFQHASDISYPNPQALAYLGWVKSRQGKDGSSWVDLATTLDPQNPEIWYLRGLHFRAHADYVASLDAMSQAVLLAPNNAGLYAELGTAFGLIGDVEQAEYWLDYAVDASANTPEYQRILENFYIETAYVSPSSIVDSLAELALTSDNANLIAAYGWALHNSGDSDRGLEQITRALEIDANNARALLNRARIYLDTNREAEALPILEQVAQTYTPAGQEAQNLLAALDTP